MITDKDLLKAIYNNEDNAIIILYDEYTLTIAEIAAIFNMNYFNANKRIKGLDIKSSLKQGRRNSSYGAEFSEDRKQKISKSHVGKSPSKPPYQRTPEIRKKISDTLKEGYLSGRISVNRDGISQAWKDGKYKEAAMGRGI